MYQKVRQFCLIFVLVQLMCPAVFAQLKSSKYKGSIQKVDSGGVYRIELSPDLIAKSNDSLSDIRLKDSDGKNVAYVLSNKLRLQSTNNFIIFPGISENAAADTGVIYVAENKNALDISQLWLKLKNTAVNRTVNLSGSDDLKNWFAIEEDIPLEQAGRGSAPDYLQSLIFPTSNYRYFKVQVNGRNKTPIKILQAGIYTTSLNKPVYIQLSQVKYKLDEKGNRTRIFIHSNQPYLVNKLHFAISAPKYYNRRIVVYAITGKYADDKLIDTIITSSGSQDIIISTKERQIGVDIYNGDDSPLTIQGITRFQTKLYAVCYLDSGRSYNIYTGDPEAKIANYDLSFLKNLAYNQLAGITHSALHKNPAYVILPHPEKNDNNSIWLWVALIMGLMVLSFLTLKMVREIK